VVSFSPRPLYPRVNTPGTHWIGGWVYPRAGVDDVEKRTFLTYRDSNSDPSVVQPVASRCTVYAAPAPDLHTRHSFFASQTRRNESNIIPLKFQRRSWFYWDKLLHVMDFEEHFDSTTACCVVCIRHEILLWKGGHLNTNSRITLASFIAVLFYSE
jgi:hypothetical protein